MSPVSIEFSDVLAFSLIFAAVLGVGYLSWASRRGEQSPPAPAQPKPKGPAARRRRAKGVRAA